MSRAFDLNELRKKREAEQSARAEFANAVRLGWRMTKQGGPLAVAFDLGAFLAGAGDDALELELGMPTEESATEFSALVLEVAASYGEQVEVQVAGSGPYGVLVRRVIQ